MPSLEELLGKSTAEIAAMTDNDLLAYLEPTLSLEPKIVVNNIPKSTDEEDNLVIPIKPKKPKKDKDKAREEAIDEILKDVI